MAWSEQIWAGDVSPEDKKSNDRQDDCPVCKFLAKAYFCIASDSLNSLQVSLRIVAKTTYFYQQPDNEIILQSFFSRAPPSKSVII